MKKRNLIILISSLAVLVIALIVCIFLGVFTSSTPVDGTAAEISSKAMIYTDAYVEYADDNPELFREGIMLCDINGDDIPELFSMVEIKGVTILKYHQFRDDKVFPYEDLDEIPFDVALVKEPATFHENSDSFIGLYRNKITGERVLISSCDASGNIYKKSGDTTAFSIVSFNGTTMTVSNGVEEVEDSKDNKKPATLNKDEIMLNYELIDGGLHYAYPHDDLIDSPRETLYSLITKFEGGSGIVYNQIDNGTFYCYVKDVNFTEGKAILVPVYEISLEDYTNAMKGNRVIKVNDEVMSVHLGERDYTGGGVATLYASQGRTYYFDSPTEEEPAKVVENYRRKRSVKVDVTPETKVRYGIVDYDENGSPANYKTAGKEREYTLGDYMAHYSEYAINGYYKAVISEGKLRYLDVVYK